MPPTQTRISHYLRWSARKSDAYVRTIQPDLSDKTQQRTGLILGILKIEAIGMAGEALAVHIEDALIRGLSEAVRRLPLEATHEAIFEATMAKVNNALTQAIGEKRLPISTDKFSGILLSQRGLDVAAAVWGGPSFLLFHPSKATGQIKVFNLLEEDEPSKSSDRSAKSGRNYLHLITGRLTCGDKVLISTDDLRQTLGTTELAPIIADNDPEAATAILHEVFSARKESSPLALFVTDAVECQVTEAGKSPGGRADQPAKRLSSATQRSIEKLLSTESKTRSIMSQSFVPSLLKNIGGAVSGGLGKLKGALRPRRKDGDPADTERTLTGYETEIPTSPEADEIDEAPLVEDENLVNQDIRPEEDVFGLPEAAEPEDADAFPPEESMNDSPEAAAESEDASVLPPEEDVFGLPEAAEPEDADAFPPEESMNDSPEAAAESDEADEQLPEEWITPEAEEEIPAHREYPAALLAVGHAILSVHGATAAVTSKEKRAQTWKKVTDRVDAWCRLIIGKFNGLPATGRYLLLTILAIIIVLNHSIILSSWQRQREEVAASYDRTASSIKQKIDSAEASLIYRDEERAIGLLEEATAMIDQLPGKNDAQKQLKEVLIGKVAAKYEAMRKEIRLGAPDILASIATEQEPAPKLVRLAESTDTIWAASATGAVFKISRKDGTSSKAGGTPEGKHPNIFLTTTANTLLAWGGGGKLASIPFSGPATEKNINLGTEPLEVADADTYNGRLYLLDPTHNRIIRVDPVIQGYGPPQFYLKDATDVSAAVSLTIDGTIYVLMRDGRIIRLIKGTQDPFTAGRVDPAPGAPRKIRTWEESNYIYVLDASPNRLICFDKQTGALIAQYSSESLHGATDFLVDEKARVALFAVGNQVLRFSLPELK
jgi:hypothetical protein